MQTVRCTTLSGESRHVPIDQIIERPAVYGFLVNNNQLLLYRALGSGTLSLPGGKIEKGESAAEALARETLEEFGMHCTDLQPVFSDEAYYFDERKHQGFHAVIQYFRGGVAHDERGPIVHGQVEVANPIWKSLPAVDPLEFHTSGRAAIEKFLATVV